MWNIVKRFAVKCILLCLWIPTCDILLTNNLSPLLILAVVVWSKSESWLEVKLQIYNKVKGNGLWLELSTSCTLGNWVSIPFSTPSSLYDLLSLLITLHGMTISGRQSILEQPVWQNAVVEQFPLHHKQTKKVHPVSWKLTLGGCWTSGGIWQVENEFISMRVVWLTRCTKWPLFSSGIYLLFMFIFSQSPLWQKNNLKSRTYMLKWISFDKNLLGS